jgi:pSer/pThr/pTyr-binding forkhead associated (FHA) protein
VGKHSHGGKKPDIVIPSSYDFVSRVQCGFTIFPFESGDSWVIKDGSLVTLKNSENGTFVNGVKLGDIEIKRLKSNDIITFSNQFYPFIKFVCEGLDAENKEEFTTSSYEFVARLYE